MYIATIVPENHFRTIQAIQEINPHLTQVIEEDRQNEETHKIHHKITTIDQIIEITTPDLIQTQHSLLLDLIPNHEIDTIKTINHENSSYNRNRNYSNNRNRSYSNNRNHYYQNNRSRNNSYNRPNSNYQNRSRNNSQNRHSSYNNRYRNYSQSPHRNNNHYNNSNNRHRSSTPKTSKTNQSSTV